MTQFRTLKVLGNRQHDLRKHIFLSDTCSWEEEICICSMFVLLKKQSEITTTASFPAAALWVSGGSPPGSTAGKFDSSPQSDALWESRQRRSGTLCRCRTTTSAWPLTVTWSPRRKERKSRRSWPLKPAWQLTTRRCTCTGRTMPSKRRFLWNWCTKKTLKSRFVYLISSSLLSAELTCFQTEKQEIRVDLWVFCFISFCPWMCVFIKTDNGGFIPLLLPSYLLSSHL